MQFLIVPVVLAVLWYFQIFPVPGYAWVIMCILYLCTCHLETLINRSADQSRARDNAIQERLDTLIEGLNK